MAATTQAVSDGGLLALCLGFVLTLIGGLLVTDFRGFTQWFVLTAEATRAELRRLPPFRWLPERSGWTTQVGMARTMGGLFAALGSLMLVGGVLGIAQGHAGSVLLHVHRPSGPGPFINVVIAVVWLIYFWRPRGSLTGAWDQGGVARRALALVSSAAAVGFPTAWWFGLPMLALVSVIVCGLTALAVISPLSRHVGTREEAEQ